MQTFDDLKHTSRSLNACIYYEISEGIRMITKQWFHDGKITLSLYNWTVDINFLTD